MTEEVSQPKRLKKKRGLSIAVYPLGLGGSNAERLEIEAMFAPPYNAASYGLSLTTSPYQADVILLYGSLTEKIGPLVYNLLSSLPSEVKLVALGSEALTGAPFANAYAVAGPFLDLSTPMQPVITEVADVPVSNVEENKADTEIEKQIDAIEQATDSDDEAQNSQAENIEADSEDVAEIATENEDAAKIEVDDELDSIVADEEELQEVAAIDELGENTEDDRKETEVAEADGGDAIVIAAESLADETSESDVVADETIEPVNDDSTEISEAEIRVIAEPEADEEPEGAAEPQSASEPVVTVQGEAMVENEVGSFAPQKSRKGVPLPANLHIAGYIAGSPPDPQAIVDGILSIMTASR